MLGERLRSRATPPRPSGRPFAATREPATFETRSKSAEPSGECWTWTAIDAETKLILSFRLGDRGLNTADDFMHDLAARPMVALYFMYYNFGQVHQTLRVPPAMEAHIADHVWSIEEIVALLEAR